jgi:hypothetical protein
MTKTQRQNWYDLACDLQNEPENIHADKMTIMAFMPTPNELFDHVLRMGKACNRGLEIFEKVSFNLEDYGFKA